MEEKTPWMCFGFTGLEDVLLSEDRKSGKGSCLTFKVVLKYYLSQDFILPTTTIKFWTFYADTINLPHKKKKF